MIRGNYYNFPEVREHDTKETDEGMPHSKDLDQLATFLCGTILTL